MAWARHGKYESDAAALCKSNGKKTHSKPLAARHGRGTACARHAMCESAFILLSTTRSVGAEYGSNIQQHKESLAGTAASSYMG